MTASIVACGPSASEWYKTPCDLSIGVNDCAKFGHDVDYLVVVNVPQKFTPRPKNGFQDRLSTIINSKPKRFLCHSGQWKSYFPNAELMALKPFSGSVLNGRYYSSKTSPFVAVTVAVAEGAKDIILWGVDFKNHPHVKDKLLSQEVSAFKRLFDALERKGIRVWLGAIGAESVFSGYLKNWDLDRPMPAKTFERI